MTCEVLIEATGERCPNPGQDVLMGTWTDHVPRQVCAAHSELASLERLRFVEPPA